MKNNIAHRKWPLVGIALGIGLLLLPRLVPAQEEKKPAEEKKAYQALLQKAEEEYRRFFEKPTKPHEFWAAMRFELDTGKFDLAALHLKLLLEQPKDETDKALVKIEEAQGMFAFLRLRTIRKWSADPDIQKDATQNVEILIDRVTSALEKHLSDPERIRKFIGNLDAKTVEERTFAFYQLQRSRERAVPYLIEALQSKTGALRSKVKAAMIALPREIVPAFLEVLKAHDAKDAGQEEPRLTLVEIVHERSDKRAIPYLWHLSTAAQYPLPVRAQAKKTLAYLLETHAEKLPPAKMPLTDLAEQYYHHKITFPEARLTKEERKAFEEAHPKQSPVVHWEWNGHSLSRRIEPLPAVEQRFGVRYAREALDLDPAYLPAQIVFLNLTLDRAFAPELDKALFKTPPPALERLLATVDSDVLLRVLERAMDEHKVSVMLPALRALGERGEVRAARAPDGPPRGIVRALHYPDRRVQFAAVQAMLRMPASPTPVASVRMVDILRRLVAAEPMPRALLAFTPADRTHEFRMALKTAGFDTKSVASPKEALRTLTESADFDVLLLHEAGGDELPYALAQLRADRDHGRLPLLLIATRERRDSLRGLAERYANAGVISEIDATGPELKAILERHIEAAAGAKITTQERKNLAEAGLDVLWRMARGEYRGYDIRPAQDAILSVVAKKDEDLAVQALEILGRLPGAEVQQRLAGVVLDPGMGRLRNTAARELNRHIQQHSLLLSNEQLRQVRTAYANPKEDADLRSQLAVVIGSLRPSTAQTGARLQDFQPDPPPPPPKKEKKADKVEKGG